MSTSLRLVRRPLSAVMPVATVAAMSAAIAGSPPVHAAAAQHAGTSGKSAAQVTQPAGLSPVASVLMGIVRGTPAGPTAMSRLTAGNRNPDQLLNAACQEITTRAPVALDSTTRLDGCRGGPGKRVAFHLTLVNFDATREGTEAFMKSARPVLVRGICRNPDVVMLGRNGVTLVFRYTGIGNRAVGDLTVEPGACTSQDR